MPISAQEAAPAGMLADLCGELRGILERVEAASQKHWGDPLDEHSALRRALRAELTAQRPAPRPEPCAAPCAAPPWPPLDSHRSSEAPVFRVASPASPIFRVGSPASPCFRGASPPSKGSPEWRVAHSVNMYLPTPAPEISDENGLIGRVRLTSWRLIHRHGTAFDAAIGLVILASSIFVGVEIQCDLEGSATCMSVAHNLEHVFLVVFLLELLIRVLSDGCGVWRSGWFRFDFALVALGVISAWVVEPIIWSTIDSDGNVIVDVLSQVLMLRILRLTRLVRALRIFEQFQEMWKLANGLIYSLRTVLSACVLIMLTVYGFACLGVELITTNLTLLEDPVTAEVVQENFSSLKVAMLTLIGFANADSISAVYKPIVERAWYLAFYFGLVWLVVTIMLMNLITAVVVDTAITHGNADRELDRHVKRTLLRKLGPDIGKVFEELDKDGTGTLSLNEFRCGLSDGAASISSLPAELRDILDSDRLIEVFEYLDTDGSKEIDRKEFTDGVLSLALGSVPIETTQMLQLLRSQRVTLRRIQEKVSVASHRQEWGEPPAPWGRSRLPEEGQAARQSAAFLRSAAAGAAAASRAPAKESASATEEDAAVGRVAAAGAAAASRAPAGESVSARDHDAAMGCVGERFFALLGRLRPEER